MSRRLSFTIALVAGLFLMQAAVLAQAPGSVSVRVETSVTGATFWVDGQPYTNSALFTWPEGSKHTLEIRNHYLFQNAPSGYVVDPNQYDPTFQTRFSFQGWQSSDSQAQGTSSAVQVITADKKVTFWRAVFVKEHGVFFIINSEPVVQFLGACNGNVEMVSGSGLQPSRAGFLDTSFCGCLSTSGYAWIQEGSPVQVNPVAYPGWVFAGFENPPGPLGAGGGSVIIDRPMSIRARFVEARRVYFETAPVRGLQVMVNRNVIPTKRTDADCLPVATPPGFPPQDTPFPNPGNPIPPFTDPVTSGRVCKRIPLCNGEADLLPGTDHVLAATASQTDAMGKLWVFDSWDIGDGKAHPQNTVVRISQDYRPFTFTARFVEGARVGFLTSQNGLKLNIDGRDNYPSYNFEWGVGHTHTVSAPLEQRDSKGRMWRFKGWSNGGPVEQTITVPADAVANGFRLIAEYELLGQLTVKSEPSTLKFLVGGAECATPCTIDRAAGEQVAITPVLDMDLSPDTKIELSGWLDSGDKERTFTFTQDAKTITARYQYMHRLTLLSDPGDAVDWTLEPAAGPGGFFTAGVKVDIKAEPRMGFKFRRFDGALTGTYPMGSLTMSAPRTIAARMDRVPALPERAVRNAAGETPERVVAPGSIIAVEGVNLAPSFASASTNPLPQTLLGLTVSVRDRLLPLIFVAENDLQAQLYSDFAPGEHELTVRTPNQPAVSAKFTIAANAPGLFRSLEFDPAIAEAYRTNGKQVTPSDPAKAGETILLCGTGFGMFNPHPLDGFKVADQPQRPLADPIELFVNGEPRPVLAAYAQPGRVGRVLVRFQLGAETPSQAHLQIRVRVKGRDSNTVLLPVSTVKTQEEPTTAEEQD